MLFVAGENLLPILVALLIGFVTGLWIWKFARKVVVKPEPAQDAPLRRPYVDNRPPPAMLDEDAQPFPAPRAEPEVLARRGAIANESRVLQAAPAAAQAAATEAVDDLQIMKGVGPKLASLLRAQGITRYDQIAALTGEDLDRLDVHLGAFKGRLTRDRIVEQAAFLAAGDRDGYEKAFGRI